VSYNQPAILYGYDREAADDLTATNVPVKQVSHAIGIPSGQGAYYGLSLTFIMQQTNGPDGATKRASTSFIHLAASDENPGFPISTSNYPQNTGYYGIVLGIDYDPDNPNPYRTMLYVMRDNRNYYYNILGGIDWGDGSRYTVELYFDSDGSEYAERFKLFIYRDSVLVSLTVVDTSFEFTGSIAAESIGRQMSASQLASICNTTVRRAGVTLADAKMTVYSLNFGEKISMWGHDYLYQGGYMQKTGVNAIGGVSDPNPHALTLANQIAQPYYGMYNSAVLKFKIDGHTADPNGFVFYFAHNEQDWSGMNSGNRLALIYNSVESALYFTFYIGLNRTYVLQKIADIDFTDGAVHTVSVQIDRTRRTGFAPIPGVVENNSNLYYYRTLSVAVDGVQYDRSVQDVPLCFPYHNTAAYWMGPSYTIVGGTTLGLFISGVTYSTLVLNRTAMTVYEFETGYKSVTTQNLA
jgi:hypothetical protein